MRSLCFALLLVLIALPVQAFPHLTVTACDTISTAPLQVRTTFTLDMTPPTCCAWYDMFVWAQPGTQLIGCAGVPAGFNCESFPDWRVKSLYR